jgi:hypothetical protein
MAVNVHVADVHVSFTYQAAGRRTVMICPALTGCDDMRVLAGVDVGPMASVTAVPDAVAAK